MNPSDPGLRHREDGSVIKHSRNGILAAALATLLAACGAEGESPTSPPSTSPGQVPQNAAPTITGSPPSTVAAGTTYLFHPVATDPEADALTFSATGLPGWASVNAQTGVLYGTPAETDVGTTASIVVSVTDGRSSAALPAFQITITSATPPPPPPPPPPSNTAPAISGSPSLSVQASSPYSFTPSASDAQGQAITFSIANRPSWAAFSATTGTLSGTPTAAGTHANIVITASDGTLTTSLPAFSITVTAAANRAPTISGTPTASIATGASYSFTPSASDPDNDTLAFTVTGKPSWLAFSTATGALTGTAVAGTYPNIVISVSDGTVTRSLPAFTLTVQNSATGSATLTWVAPTENTDGSALTDLAGYRLYHGTSVNALHDVVQVPGATPGSYTFQQLASGTHYFAIAAYNAAGTESSMSAVGSKVIP